MCVHTYVRMYDDMHIRENFTLCKFSVTTEKIPATVIAYPGQDAELFCSVSSSNYQIISWKVNNMGPYGLATLREGRLTGYSSNGNGSLIVENITTNDVRNGSNYNCVITSGIAVQRQRDPTILYVAGEYVHIYVHM